MRQRLKELERRLRPVESGVTQLAGFERRVAAARLDVGRLDYEPRELFLRIDSPAVLVRLRACAKEPWTVAWIESDVGPGEVLYDVGANTGPYSLIAASAGEGRRVVALEPAGTTYGSLLVNVALNELATTITPLPIALSDATGLATLELSSLEPGDALHTLDDVPVRYSSSPSTLRQPTLAYRLDDLVTQLDVPFPNHLKIDVDGAELAILRGAERTLSDKRLRSLLIEVEVTLGDDVVALLDSVGFPIAERHQRRDADTHWYGIFKRG
jgi:FkbM family methyltransferase